MFRKPEATSLLVNWCSFRHKDSLARDGRPGCPGRETVQVLSLKVGLASTGSELVPPGHSLGPGQIYDINTYTIAAGVQECGASAVPYGILPDEREEMAMMLQKMAGSAIWSW